MFGLYKKLLTTYLSILALIIVIISLLLFQFFKTDLFDKSQNELLDAGQYINTLLIQFERGDIEERDLVQSVNSIGHITNSRIIVIEGIEFIIDQELHEQFGLEGEELFHSLNDIFAGETIVKQYQYSESLDSYVIAVGMPVKISGEIVGAIILFTPAGQLDTTLTSIIKMIAITAIATFIVGFVLIFFVSRSISRPIVAVSKSAQQLAAGKQVQDIKSSSKDEIGQLVTSFNGMKEQLVQTEKMRKELIAGVSHELRAPLTAIRGYVQGIIDGVIDEKDQTKYLVRTLDETHRLTRITNDLLDLAKLESGSISMVKGIINVQRVVDDAVEITKAQMKDKGIVLQVKNATEILLTADGDRLKQVISNLLENALHYTETGGEIAIEVNENSTTVVIIVKDTGIGIPIEEIDFIFDKFYRVEKSRNQALGGIGLGLAIVKNIVELHKGTIRVDSKVGEGSTFIIEIPKN